MTAFLIFDAIDEAQAAAVSIYEALHLNAPDRRTTAWDTPRQRFDGKWIILAPDNEQLFPLLSYTVETFQIGWFDDLNPN